MRDVEERFFAAAKAAASEIPPPEPPRPAAPSPPARKRKRWLLWSVVAAGVVVVVALVGFLLVALPWPRQWGSPARINQQDGPTETAADAAEALKRKYRNAPASLRTGLNALKKFQARTEVGLNITQYSEGLGETWGQVKIVVESSEGRRYEEAAQHFRLAVTCYRAAQSVWAEKVRFVTFPYPHGPRFRFPEDLDLYIGEIAAGSNRDVAGSVKAASAVAMSLGQEYERLREEFSRALEEGKRAQWQGGSVDLDTKIRAVDDAKPGVVGGMEALMQCLWKAAGVHITKADALLNP